MLSPLDMLLVNQQDQEHDGNDDELTSDLSPKLEPGPPHSDTFPDINHTQTFLPHTYYRDLEDAIADEMPQNNVDSSIVVQGQKTSKAKALCH